jgi:hypothetical protein
VVATLRRMGLDQAAEEALKQLPDPVDLDQVNMLCDRLAISRGELISRMGGSPLRPGTVPPGGRHPARVARRGVAAQAHSRHHRDPEPLHPTTVRSRRLLRLAGGFGVRCEISQRSSAALATALSIARGSGLTDVPATRTVGVASTPRAVARAVTHVAQSR